MCHRAAIFSELYGLQEGDILNSLDCPRAHIRGKFRITVYGKPFLQTKLKPISAGDSVARPIVKIFMSYNRLDTLKGEVGRGLWAGEHTRSVKYIQALVLHRTHVEVIDSNDHEYIEVVFATIDFLVPAHRIFQR